MKHIVVVSLVVFFSAKFVVHDSTAILSLDDYCEKYPENLRPVLCLIKGNNIVPKNSTTTTAPRIIKPLFGWKPPVHHHRPRPPPPPPHHGSGWSFNNYESSSEEEDDETAECCCDIKCIPPSPDDGVRVICTPCGNSCDVTTSTTPTCSCATFGAGVDNNSTTVPTLCSCSVTCASNPQWPGDDPYCIYNITGVSSPTDRRPVHCECCKSKAAEHNNFPAFVCVCQRL